jgi:hypothetical protein
MFFVQTSTLPPRMHQKLTKHGRFCKQNNQLPTKSHVELKVKILSKKRDIGCKLLVETTSKDRKKVSFLQNNMPLEK